MATPRKRWFRLADAILREPWDRETKLIAVLLMAWLHNRWSRDGIEDDQAGNAVLGRAALLEITGRSQFQPGVNALRKLSEVVALSMEVHGETVSISWPKFAEFQELSTRGKGKKKPADRPLQSESESESESEKKRTGKAPASRKPRASNLIPKPHTFEGETLVAIQTWATEHGFSREVLRDAMTRFREWKPLKRKTRDLEQWVSAFQRIVRGLSADGPSTPTGAPRESAAQARDRRTKEAMQEAFRRMTANDTDDDDEQPTLLAISGGRS